MNGEKRSNPRMFLERLYGTTSWSWDDGGIHRNWFLLRSDETQRVRLEIYNEFPG